MTLTINVNSSSLEACNYWIIIIIYFRYQFFLQLKLDLLSGRLECPYATSVELAAMSLQCKWQIIFRRLDLNLN